MYVGVYSTVYTCSTYSSKGGGLFSKGQQPASPGRGEGGGGVTGRFFCLFLSSGFFLSILSAVNTHIYSAHCGVLVYSALLYSTQ